MCFLQESSSIILGKKPDGETDRQTDSHRCIKSNGSEESPVGSYRSSPQLACTDFFWRRSTIWPVFSSSEHKSMLGLFFPYPITSKGHKKLWSTNLSRRKKAVFNGKQSGKMMSSKKRFRLFGYTSSTFVQRVYTISCADRTTSTRYVCLFSLKIHFG